MEESIYISNFRNNIDSISNYVSILKNKSKFSFSSIHQKDDILRIVLNNNNCLDPSFIESHQLTCVVENDLFRTVYIKGTRIMWKSLHD